MKINVTQSSMPYFNEYIEEIKDLWDRKWLTNMGDKHVKLESMLVDYLKTPYVALYANGHLGLEAIIESLDLKGEVITTPFTFISTTHAIVRKGLKPVFCDINHKDYTIDVNKIERLITKETTAILPVHVYGNVCDVYRIEEIAKNFNLKVIYDAAHAFGVTVNGLGIGSFGDASMFSFHATKVFNTIEGGAVTCNDFTTNYILNAFKNFGITGPESVEFVGCNAKMNEFQAAMGICNLRHIDGEIEKRKKVVFRYMENLKGISGIQLPEQKDDIDGNYAYFPVLFDGYKLKRDEVLVILKKYGINARKYFYPLTSSFGCYKNQYDLGKTPIAKHISECVLALPLYADLATEDIDRICAIIKS